MGHGTRLAGWSGKGLRVIGLEAAAERSRSRCAVRDKRIGRLGTYRASNHIVQTQRCPFERARERDRCRTKTVCDHYNLSRDANVERVISPMPLLPSHDPDVFAKRGEEHTTFFGVLMGAGSSGS